MRRNSVVIASDVTSVPIPLLSLFGFPFKPVSHLLYDHPTVLGYSVCFSVFVLFAHPFLRILLAFPPAQRLSAQPRPDTNKRFKDTLHFRDNVSGLERFFLVHQNIHLSSYIAHLFLHAAYCIHWSHLHINRNCFKFSANSNTPTTSDSDSFSPSSNSGFAFQYVL